MATYMYCAKIIPNFSGISQSAESWYLQTGKEALAIVWGIERLHLYLYGVHFTLYTVVLF